MKPKKGHRFAVMFKGEVVKTFTSIWPAKGYLRENGGLPGGEIAIWDGKKWRTDVQAYYDELAKR